MPAKKQPKSSSSTRRKKNSAAPEPAAQGAAEVKSIKVEYKRPDLYPKQFAALFDPRRISVIEASTKAGKTSAAIVWLIEQALKGKAAQNYWWVAPVSAQAEDAFDRTARAIPHDQRATYLSKPKFITLFNGARIWFHSAEHPDALYGRDVYACVVDEASRVKELAWHAVMTTLTATYGPMRIIGNVKGRKNWFYQLARRAQAYGDDMTAPMGYHKMIAHDAIAAGVLKPEAVEDSRREMPDAIFRELYLAEPSDDTGNPFGLKYIRAAIAPVSSGQPVVWGWDLAKSHDWTVGIALDRNGHVCRFERFQHDWETTYRIIIKETGFTKALVDSTGVGDPLVERMQKHSSNFEGYNFTGPGKQKLMEGLAVAIQQQQVRYPDGPIVAELENFEYEYGPTGRVKYQAIETGQGVPGHDDCVCALALAVQHTVTASSYDSSLAWVGGPTADQKAVEEAMRAVAPAMLEEGRRWVPGRGWM